MCGKVSCIIDTGTPKKGKTPGYGFSLGQKPGFGLIQKANLKSVFYGL
jgi:hypothetical protein